MVVISANELSHFGHVSTYIRVQLGIVVTDSARICARVLPFYIGGRWTQKNPVSTMEALSNF